MSLTDYIIAKQLGMAPVRIATRPTIKRRQTCANCGRHLAYSGAGFPVHTATGREGCYR